MEPRRQSFKDAPLSHRLHVKYFLRFLNILPDRLSSHDSTRLMIAFFAVSGLDVLNALDSLSPDEQKNIIEWIYRLQVIPKEGDPPVGGFQGSSTLNTDDPIPGHYRCGHLAMTYTSLCTLLILGDDLSRVNKKTVIEGVAALQLKDGSFSATLSGSEADMRFAFCAAAVCYILGSWGTVNKEAMRKYVVDSMGYDFGIAQGPNLESHGGTTYCGISALYLSGYLHSLTPLTKDKLTRWSIFRQTDGFNGRPNKLTDTCYSFWNGATLKILNAFQFTCYESNREYVMSTEDSTFGGFSKWPDSQTDPLHTYLGLCGLSLMGEPGLNEVHPSLNISMRAFNRLKEIQAKWDTC